MTATEERLDGAAEAFSGVDLTASSQFAFGVHVSVFALVDHLRLGQPSGDVAAVVGRYPFLSGYLEAVLTHLPPGLSWRDGRAWWQTAVSAWEEPAGDVLPLSRLASLTSSPWTARMQVVLAGLVDEDSRFGSLFEELNGGVASRPTLEVLAAVATDGCGGGTATARRLVDLGVIEVRDRTPPRSEWIAHLPAELWDALRGDPITPGHVRHVHWHDLPSCDELVLPPQVAGRAQHLAAATRDRLDLVMIRGSAGSDRTLVAGAIAHGGGHGMLTVDPGLPPDRWPLVGAMATALDALPVVELDPAPGETVELPRPDSLALPLVAVMAGVGGVDRRRCDRALSLDIPALDATTRRRRWETAFGNQAVDDLDEITARCGLQGAHIDRVARSAVARARAEGRHVVTTVDVRQAAADLQRQLLDTLAAPLEAAGTWSDVVVGDFTAEKLVELEMRCRFREHVGASLAEAYGAGTGSGVRAQFSGASGTGKTLAARVLAARLGLDVYRVDLSAIVNKYVGETEKNLHRVLTIAEDLDVVLLVDEGDSLLGRRTEVRTANDRFANLETNYLLQRLESYRGIIVVTTNAAENIDPAFQRRLDVVVTFLPPSARERAEIWRLHLPPTHDVSDAVLDEVSARCAMTGGQIRNAVLHATMLALADDRPIDERHLAAAVASEYRKAGATSPFDPSGRRHGTSRARSIRQAIS